MKALEPVISGRPILNSSGQSATTFAIGLYLIVGLVIFGFALREKSLAGSTASIRDSAARTETHPEARPEAHTEEELEDQWIDRGATSDPTSPPHTTRH